MRLSLAGWGMRAGCPPTGPCVCGQRYKPGRGVRNLGHGGCTFEEWEEGGKRWLEYLFTYQPPGKYHSASQRGVAPVVLDKFASVAPNAR